MVMHNYTQLSKKAGMALLQRQAAWFSYKNYPYTNIITQEEALDAFQRATRQLNWAVAEQYPSNR